MARDQSHAKNDAVKDAWNLRRWGEYLVAILGGNIIYLFIEPELPSILRHRMFRVDLGLGIDFVICVAAYVLVHQLRSLADHHG